MAANQSTSGLITAIVLFLPIFFKVSLLAFIFPDIPLKKPNRYQEDVRTLVRSILTTDQNLLSGNLLSE